MAMDEEIADFESYLNDKAVQFDQLVDDRLNEQQEKEGVISFVEEDVVKEYLNTLADTVNYCRMQAVKLLVLQESLAAQLGSQMGKKTGDDIQIGAQSFKGMGGKE